MYGETLSSAPVAAEWIPLGSEEKKRPPGVFAFVEIRATCEQDSHTDVQKMSVWALPACPDMKDPVCVFCSGASLLTEQTAAEHSGRPHPAETLCQKTRKSFSKTHFCFRHLKTNAVVTVKGIKLPYSNRKWN